MMESSSSTSSSTKPLFRGTQVVWYLLGALQILLAFRFVLKLLGANPEAGFSAFIYGLSYPFVAPFLSVFGTAQIEGSIFEWTTLLAMLVYSVVAWGLINLFSMSRSVSTPEAAQKMDNPDN